MRLGLLTRFLAVGDENDSGLGQHFRILADALAAEGQSVHVVQLAEQPERAAAALTALGPAWTWEIVDARPPRWLYRPLRLSWSSYALLAHLWSAREVARRFSASRLRDLDVVETHTYNLPALFLPGRRRRPRIVSRVATTMSQMVAISPVKTRALAWEAALERRATRRSDVIVTHTRQHRDVVCALEHHDPARFRLVPLGVPDPSPVVDDPPAPAADAPVEFLFVGRFENRKGIDVLLAAIPAVAAAFPSAHFTLAGDRGDGVAWREFERAHPGLVGSRVHSPGRVSAAELTRLYRRCDVFVAPSRYESFGLIFTEAMSHGKPVIGCRAGGMPEVVNNGVTGLLAEPGDVPTLVASMSALAGDAARRREMGRAARADFVARFSAAQLARASVALYREILTLMRTP